ncbi:hypothetical protein BJ546DRAFT_1017219 [Cryomyces antarcticus]
MPPHLHPRSRLTTSLFTTTLLVSFLVVGMPHVLPCPVDTRQYADGPGSYPADAATVDSTAGISPDTQRRRRRRRVGTKAEDVGVDAGTSTDGASDEEDVREGSRRRRRECPVPKPGGLVGQIMGFRASEKEPNPRVVIVESVRARRRTDAEGKEKGS